MGVLEELLETKKQLLSELAEIRTEQAIQGKILEHMGWIPALQVMNMKVKGLTSWDGLNGAEKRGELLIDKSKKKALVSVKSLLALLRQKGYTPEYIQSKVAA